MKILPDANISWRLSAKLASHFEECFHVDYIGLPLPVKDMEIWNFALLNGLVIITNDDDFLNLSNMKGFPPKVVLLRTGNQANNYIENLLIRHKEHLSVFYLSPEIGVLEILAA